MTQDSENPTFFVELFSAQPVAGDTVDSSAPEAPQTSEATLHVATATPVLSPPLATAGYVTEEAVRLAL